MKNRIKIPAVLALLVLLGATCFQAGVYAQSGTTIYPAFFTDPDFTTINSTQYYIGATNLTSFFNSYQDPTFTSVTSTTVNSTLWYSGSANVTDILNYPDQPLKYEIIKDGSTYLAKNGDTGAIDYKGANASDVANDAITAADTGLIKFGSGTFVLDSPLLPRSNMTIELSPDTILQAQAATDVVLIRLDGVTNVRIEGGLLDGNKVNQAGAVTGSNQADGIHVTGPSYYFTLENIVIKDTKGWGISIGQGQHGNMINCNLSGITEKGINPNSALTSFIDIVRCTVGTSGGGAYTSDAIEIDDGATDILVDSCTVTASQDRAVSIHSHNMGDSPKRVTVQNSHFISPTGAEVGVFVGVNRNATDHIQSVQILNNFFVDCGISVHYNDVQEGSKSNQFIIISGNDINGTVDNWNGINVELAYGLEISKNNVRSADNHGIYVTLVEGYSIIGNTVTDCDSCGICMNAIYGIASGNVVDKNGQDTGLDGSVRSGIRVAAANCTIIGNTVRDSQTVKTQYSGLTIRTGAYNCTVTGNIIGPVANIPIDMVAVCSASSHIWGNPGFTTENSGSVGNCISGTTITHGLAGTPNGQITAVCNTTGIIVTVVPSATTLTLGMVWWNGTAVDADHSPATVYWYAQYRP